MEAKSEVVARRPEAGTPAPTAIWRRSSAKIVHQAYVEIVTIAVGGRNVVEVLGCARQIGQRDVLEQSLRNWTDLAARRS